MAGLPHEASSSGTTIRMPKALRALGPSSITTLSTPHRRPEFHIHHFLTSCQHELERQRARGGRNHHSGSRSRAVHPAVRPARTARKMLRLRRSAATRRDRLSQFEADHLLKRQAQSATDRTQRAEGWTPPTSEEVAQRALVKMGLASELATS